MIFTRTKRKGLGWQTAGGVFIGSFVFAFDTPGLNDGIVFYEPTLGDVLIGARVVADTVFDGTTPRCDFGIADQGVLGNSYDFAYMGDEPESVSGLRVNTHSVSVSLVEDYAAGSYAAMLSPVVDEVTWKLWVSQNGLVGGDPVGGTQGRGRIIIATATPASLNA